MAAEPLYFFRTDLNHTVVSLRFAGHTILTEQEEWSYSFGSLVADLGGLLGLFVGFNFMQLWDLVLLALTFVRRPHPSKNRINANEKTF